MVRGIHGVARDISNLKVTETLQLNDHLWTRKVGDGMPASTDYCEPDNGSTSLLTSDVSLALKVETGRVRESTSLRVDGRDAR